MSAAATGNLWGQALEVLRSRIDEESFATFFEEIRSREFADGQLELIVPSLMFRNWLISNYQEAIDAAVTEVAHREVNIHFALASGEEGESTPVPAPPRGNNGAGSLAINLQPNRINPNYTFDRFVVGESNRFAHAAAQAVADPSSRVYNPLFLYGPVGLGKTHLLHAIGHAMRGYGSHLNVLYVTAETFMNAFIEGIQKKDVAYFRDCFRSVDLLMVDDVQFFAGAERTQTEFFHTFNHLFGAGKKIAISSDHPPKELPELEERLRSRFEQGLIVDVQPPDLETRVAILRRKARQLNIDFSPEIEIYIAECIKTNVRRLEGALLKISAHHAVSGEPMTLASVRALLGPFFTGGEPVKIGVDKIQGVVCKFFDITQEELVGSNRARKFSGPRQIACHLCRELTDLSYPEIARQFGGRDHTSILHACRKVSEEIEADLSKRNLVKYLVKLVKEGPGALPPH